jgi:adenine-specific DNA-methyltransferase
MIKYLGSKRRLVPVLTEICRASGARTALDLFTGTTRVAQAFKGQGVHVTAVDSARYAHAFARTYIETDAAATDMGALGAAVAHLNAIPGKRGYVHDTFSRQARFFQPDNAARIDAVRDAIDADYAGSPLFPLLLTSLLEAADRVDSTTGVQMAYVKKWARRSYNPLELRVPLLLPGCGRTVRGDACHLAASLGEFDVAYVDPPYNQHRYFTNYHIWETLVAWDAPLHYGVACKRDDARHHSTKSVFNSRRTMPEALSSVVRQVRSRVLLLSYNDEGWISRESLEEMCGHHERVETLAFDSRRYVGAQIGIFNPEGEKVGTISHLHNREYVVVAGPAPDVLRVTGAARRHAGSLVDLGLASRPAGRGRLAVSSRGGPG